MTRLEIRWSRSVIQFLLVAAAAFSPELLPAQEIRIVPAQRRDPGDAVVQQINGRNMVRHNAGWLMLPEWLTVEPAAADDGEVEAAVEGDTTWRAWISDAGFDHSVFCDFSDATVARQNLDELLRQDMDDLSEHYALTAAQKQKLHLAGRGDIKRLFDRIEETRRLLQTHVVQDITGIKELSQKLSRESNPLRTSLRRGPFREGSLFAKTLKRALTADQIVIYEKRKRDRTVVVTRSWDLGGR